MFDDDLFDLLAELQLFSAGLSVVIGRNLAAGLVRVAAQICDDILPRLIRLCRNVFEKEVLEGYRFRCAMCLHEDYDAQGVYLYEVRPAHEKAIGPELLAAAGYYVPVDLRKTIEGRRAEQGWISRAIRRKNYPLVPEALFLAFTHSERTITVETPSEYDIGARVLAQIAIIQRATELVAGEELSRLGKTISKTTA